MKPWNQRPREIRNLFNPAFCGLVLARGVEGFSETTNQPMPFSLTLLILPLCLHKRTREQIKKLLNPKLHKDFAGSSRNPG